MLVDILSRRVITRLREQNAELLRQLVAEHAARMAARDEQQRRIREAKDEGYRAGVAETLASLDAQSYTCDGLQYPCGAPATHEVSECVGHDISGAPVVLTAHYCDACYAEQANWEETDEQAN